MTVTTEPVLSPALVEKILAKLGFQHAPEPTLTGLRSLYSAWGQNVPFDNVRKLIHVRSGDAGPLPGSTPGDYFNAWLKYGTGGTCWSGAGSLQALLTSLGFKAAHGVATMLAAPNLPPNHGTVLVTLGSEQFLTDSAMLCGEPLPYLKDTPSRIDHPARGVQANWKNGKWFIAWRPLHKVDGFECRVERFDANPEQFRAFYEQTRSWSPFNYEVTARLNKQDTVTGVAFGHAVSLLADGSVTRKPIAHEERNRLLIEEIGMSEEIVAQLPKDIPTPPPPGSATARAAASQ